MGQWLNFQMVEESLTFKTGEMFWRLHGIVADCGEYFRIETPANPAWYWGNLLFFKRPPTPADASRWQDLFRREFAHQPLVRHMLFAWLVEDNDAGVPEGFLDAGFELELQDAHAAQQVHPPPRFNRRITVKTIERETDWEAAMHLQVKCRDPRIDYARYMAFIRTRFADYRELIAARKGDWYGAFLDDELVADLGLFRDERTRLARFQYVETAPAHRRLGICSTLVYEAARAALEHRDIDAVVIVPEEEFIARIYQSLGFAPVERAAFLSRHPR